MKNTKKVSIVMLNWNGKKDTIECLNSLKNLDYDNYGIILVDNGSTDNSVTVLEKMFPYVKLIKNKKNLGFAKGANIGIKTALKNKADYVFLLNNDTKVNRNFLKELVRVAESNPKIGIVGPKICYYYNPNKVMRSAGKINYLVGRTSFIKNKNRDNKVHFVYGAALLIKRQVIESIGLFDPIFFMYWEELDYCTRANKAGHDIFYASNASILHKRSSAMSKQSNFSATYFKTRNKICFMKKHAKNFLFFVCYYAALSMSYFILYYLAKLDFKNLKAYLKGSYDGFKNR